MLTFFVLRTCVATMTLKKPKTHLKFSKVFNIRKLRGTVVKSPFLKKKCVLQARFPVRRDVFVY